MEDSEMADNHVIYFRDRDETLKGKQRKKKYLGEAKEGIISEWNLAWKKMLELAEETVREKEAASLAGRVFSKLQCGACCETESQQEAQIVVVNPPKQD
ncbi:17008_t:CDS:2 [Funneliformis caledonium]|uniref:17008_t:CDS:1 n=1 Tax=Funneliformis caledonium TaxID=1117310 RepID=A0A9N9GFC6_9GLOM|nr:17008_t:CDS:2 [Funneliformis caledonium]